MKSLVLCFAMFSASKSSKFNDQIHVRADMYILIYAFQLKCILQIFYYTFSRFRLANVP